MPEILLKFFKNANLITERRNLYHWLNNNKISPLTSFRNYLSKYIIVNSIQVKKKLVKVEKVDNKKIKLIYNANYLSVKKHKNKINLNFISIANIKEFKGLENSSKIFKQFYLNQSIKKFHIYGRVDSQIIYKKIYKPFYQGELLDYEKLNEYSFLVHLSEFEGFPNVILEALSYGLIPIVLSTPINLELFKNSAIFLKSPNDLKLTLTNIINKKNLSINSFESKRRDILKKFSSDLRLRKYMCLL